MLTDAALEDREWAGLVALRRIFCDTKGGFVDGHYLTSTSFTRFDDYRRFAILGKLVVARSDVLLSSIAAEQDPRVKHEKAAEVLHELRHLQSALLGLTESLEQIASSTEDVQRQIGELLSRMETDSLRSTRVERHIRAPRTTVYRLLIDPLAVVKWKVPDDMTARVHSFDAREGGSLRISLTYVDSRKSGKTTVHTDTYHGRFVRLVPDEQVVEVEEFETNDPTMAGEMVSTITLADADDGGTDLVAVHEGLPPGVALADNETGWRMALAKLAALAEAGYKPPR